MITKHLPTIDVWLACELKVVPFCFAVAKDGLFPGYKKHHDGTQTFLPAYTEAKGTHQICHVLAVGRTEAEAEERGREVIRRQ